MHTALFYNVLYFAVPIIRCYFQSSQVGQNCETVSVINLYGRVPGLDHFSNSCCRIRSLRNGFIIKWNVSYIPTVYTHTLCNDSVYCGQMQNDKEHHFKKAQVVRSRMQRPRLDQQVSSIGPLIFCVFNWTTGLTVSTEQQIMQGNTINN